MNNEALLMEYFPDGAPIVVQQAFRHGYGEALISLNSRVYNNPSPLLEPVLREAIQGLCLSSCDNKYCSIMHCRGMILSGLSFAEVCDVIESQKLPATMKDRSLWEQTLRRVVSIFREPNVAPKLYKSLAEFHNKAMIDEICGVIAFSLLHKFLLEAYSDEIDINNEVILFSTVDCGAELIKLMADYGGTQGPIISLCSICKDVKLDEHWLPIERALESLPPEARFSHGVCERCVDRWAES